MLDFFAIEGSSLTINLFDNSYNIHLDILFLVVFILITTFVSFRSKSLTISMILSFYPAILIFQTLTTHSFSFIEGIDTFVGKIILFSVLMLVILIVLNGYTTDYARGGDVVFFEAMFLSLAAAILIFTILYHIIPITGEYEFSSILNILFDKSEYLYIQLIAPLVLLFFATR